MRIVEDQAEIVRSLFRRYLGAGSVVRLKQQLDAEEVRIPIRIDGGGRSTGGGLFSRGHIYKILSNPIYGRMAHKGQIYGGHHPPIVTGDLWDEVRKAWAIISALRGPRERAKRRVRYSWASSMTTAATA